MMGFEPHPGAPWILADALTRQRIDGNRGLLMNTVRLGRVEPRARVTDVGLDEDMNQMRNSTSVLRQANPDDGALAQQRILGAKSSNQLGARFRSSDLPKDPLCRCRKPVIRVVDGESKQRQRRTIVQLLDRMKDAETPADIWRGSIPTIEHRHRSSPQTHKPIVVAGPQVPVLWHVGRISHERIKRRIGANLFQNVCAGLRYPGIGVAEENECIADGRRATTR
jgi:hypothetical protein